MGSSDEKQISYSEFMSAIGKFNTQIEKLRTTKDTLRNINNTLLENYNWKGTTKNYYSKVVEVQDKAFEEINSELADAITGLIDTCEEFKDLDNEIANGYQK